MTSSEEELKERAEFHRWQRQNEAPTVYSEPTDTEELKDAPEDEEDERAEDKCCDDAWNMFCCSGNYGSHLP